MAAGDVVRTAASDWECIPGDAAVDMQCRRNGAFSAGFRTDSMLGAAGRRAAQSNATGSTSTASASPGRRCPVLRAVWSSAWITAADGASSSIWIR